MGIQRPDAVAEGAVPLGGSLRQEDPVRLVVCSSLPAVGRVAADTVHAGREALLDGCLGGLPGPLGLAAMEAVGTLTRRWGCTSR